MSTSQLMSIDLRVAALGAEAQRVSCRGLCNAYLGLGRLGHVEGEEVPLCECLLPADQLHAQGGRLDLRGVGVICYHTGKAQAGASPGHLAANLHAKTGNEAEKHSLHVTPTRNACCCG